MISYRPKNGKYIVCKDGVYMTLTIEQVSEMEKVMQDIKAGTQQYYKEDARKAG